jgi:hypothetical protein
MLLPSANSVDLILVDNSDAQLLSQYSWRVSKQGYVYRSGGRGIVLIHRQIMRHELSRAHGWAVIDHINGDKLDNRRTNLRVVSQRENVLNPLNKRRSDNKSGVTGVHWFKGAWVAFYGRKYLGRYQSVAAAKAARLRATPSSSTF